MLSRINFVSLDKVGLISDQTENFLVLELA